MLSIATLVAAALSSHHPSAEIRASRARYRRQRVIPHPIHIHLPLPSPSTSITILPAAIDKPQSFLARGSPPWGAAGAHTHLTLSHTYHQLTCPIVHRWSWTPVIYPHGHRSRRRCCHDGTNDPLRHQQYRHAAGATLMPRRAQGLACPLGATAEGDGYHRSGPLTLMGGWGEPAPLWCGHNSLVAAWGVAWRKKYYRGRERAGLPPADRFPGTACCPGLSLKDTRDSRQYRASNHTQPPHAEATKLLCPNHKDAVARHPIRGGGLIYGIRWRWWIPRSSRAWSLPQEGPGDVSACEVSGAGVLVSMAGGVGGMVGVGPSRCPTVAPRGHASQFVRRDSKVAPAAWRYCWWRIGNSDSSDGSSCVRRDRRLVSSSTGGMLGR